MNILLKRFQLTSAGLTADGEQSFDGEKLTLGASSDRSIIIEWPEVQLRHAEATLTADNKLHVTSHAQSGIVVKRIKKHEVMLKSGQSFKIGNHEFGFTVEDGQATITITVDETATKPSGVLLKTRLAHTGISRRRWSVSLMAFIVLGFLVAPYVNRAIQNDGGLSELRNFLPSQLSGILPSGINELRPSDFNHFLPSDSSWNTGDFHPAHQLFADDCSSCHNEAFTQVSKQTCMSCHGSVAYHFPPDSLELNSIEETNCQSCHKEHNGEDGLVSDSQNLCIDCHENITEFTNGTTTLQEVKDWQHTHPEITFKMADWDKLSQQWNYEQHDASQPPAEQSGVLFPHDFHLREEGFDIGEGQPKVLACADCHAPEPGGALMLPIQMETHCESCHALDIDVDNNSRNVRHDNIENLLVEIAGLKGLNALLPAPDDQLGSDNSKLPSVSKLKLPGKLDKSSQQAKQTLTLARVATDLIEKRSCVTCHTVNSNPQALAESQLNLAWQIQPVRIIQRWIDESEFDHSKHRSWDCSTCHTDIGQSSSAADVNIPPRGLCQDCHGNPNEKHLTPSQCIDCHSYHLPDHGWIKASPADTDAPSPVKMP